MRSCTPADRKPDENMRTLRTTRAGEGGRALPVALVAFVALGLPDGMLGVAWPSMRATFDQPLAALGQLLLAGSALASATAVLAFAAAPAWPLLLVGMVALGFGGGGIDAGINAHVALRHGPGAMNLLHGCYGVGATAGPLMVTAVLAGGRSWRVPYAGLLALQVGLLTAYALTGRAWAGRRPAQ